MTASWIGAGACAFHRRQCDVEATRPRRHVRNGLSLGQRAERPEEVLAPDAFSLERRGQRARAITRSNKRHGELGLHRPDLRVRHAKNRYGRREATSGRGECRGVVAAADAIRATTRYASTVLSETPCASWIRSARSAAAIARAWSPLRDQISARPSNTSATWLLSAPYTRSRMTRARSSATSASPARPTLDRASPKPASASPTKRCCGPATRSQVRAARRNRRIASS